MAQQTLQLLDKLFKFDKKETFFLLITKYILRCNFFNFQAASIFVDKNGRIRIADYSIDKRY
jgi:hypothetical protein